MRLKKVTFRGLTRFTSAQPVSIDYDAQGPGLIALVGRNGEGKTTAMEAPAVALYKEFPSRPGLYDHVHGRDAFVEAVFEDPDGDPAGLRDVEVKVRVQIDAEARKTEGYVFVDGRSVTTGRAGEFAVEIERRFGSMSLFLSSIFSAQDKSGNFLLMPKAERKGLFIELLGLARLQALHELARQRGTEADRSLDAARNALALVEQELGGFEADKGARDLAVNQVDAAAHALATAQQEEAAAISALERAKSAGPRIAALEEAYRAAQRATEDGNAALRRAKEGKAAAEQQAKARRAALEAQDPDAMEKRAEARYVAACKSIDTRRAIVEKTLEEQPAIEQAAKTVVELEAELARLEEAERALVVAMAKRQVADGEAIGAGRRLTDAQDHVAAEKARLATEADLLARVPCTAEEEWQPWPDAKFHGVDLAGTCPLLGVALIAKERGPRLTVDPALVQAHNDACAAFDAAGAVVEQKTLECDPVRLAEVKAVLPEVRNLAARALSLDSASEQLQGLLAELQRAGEEEAAEKAAAAELRTRLDNERAVIAADLADALLAAHSAEGDAKNRADELLEREYEARDAVATAREELGALSVPAADADLSRARGVRLTAERELREADTVLARLRERCDQLQAKADTLPVLEEGVRLAEQEGGDWMLLERSLGKDGVQALEIDAAGPEVATLTNELLDACYGSRFQITFETLREKKSKAGEYSEAFDVKVFDRGHERAVEALSGGERVVVGEAIGLAISVFNARRSGVHWETLFRDETAGALDPTNAQAYVDMLRRALALGGFHQVVFVSHSPEVWERADVRLVVADGQVLVEGQPGQRTSETAAA